MRELPTKPAGANRKALLRRLGLGAGTLPAAGEWSADDDLLNLLATIVIEMQPGLTVSLGAGLPALVIARALDLAGGGTVFAVDQDDGVIDTTASQADTLGLGPRIRLLHAPLGEYDRHNAWYDRSVLGDLPSRIDLLFVDGPPHFAGRTPRAPAGAELFARVPWDGAVLLDDGKRAKEQKTLRLWSDAFPDMRQIPCQTSRGAVLLRRKEAL